MAPSSRPCKNGSAQDDEEYYGVKRDRKARKPLVEKMRRARINESLHELRGLLADSDFQTKTENAEVLEMTVKRVENILRSRDLGHSQVRTGKARSASKLRQKPATRLADKRPCKNGSAQDDEEYYGVKRDRKARKPLVEKMRRARINESLHELRGLLADSDFQTKTENAEVLEMTVKRVENILRSRDLGKPLRFVFNVQSLQILRRSLLCKCTFN
ncbi:Transcription cofactor HES-6 [Acipenser ruthenus]|uniref:Transcription cofactor HES-6 n=1 Tax=Acipenser ruthenus TaxID=7906 RepID=A0A444U662_ACIRT|nr:Transcription cofactor HES-6 [Acipenser ruthenus]